MLIPKAGTCNMETIKNPQGDHESVSKLALKHGYWAVVCRAGNVAVSALSGMLLARALTKAEFGKVSVLQTVLSVCSVIAGLGLGVASLRLIAHEALAGAKDAGLSVVRRIRTITLVYGVSIAAVIGVVISLMSNRLFAESMSYQIAVLIFFSVFLRSAQATLAELARGLHEVHISSLLSGWNGGLLHNAGFLAAVFVAAAFSSVTWKAALLFDVGALVASTVLGVYGLEIALRKLQNKDTSESGFDSDAAARVHLSSSSTARVFEIAIPIMLTTLAAFALEQGDVVLAGLFCSETDVPLYASAKRCSLLLRVPFAVVNMTVMGVIAPLYASKQMTKLQDILQASAAVSGACGILIAILMSLSPDRTLSLLFGASYSEGAELLLISIVGQLAVVLTGSCQQVMLLAKGERAAFVINSSGLFLAMLLALPSYRLFGRNGFAISYCGVLAAANVLQWLYVRRVLRIRTEPSLRSIPEFIRKSRLQGEYVKRERGNERHN